MTSMVKTEPTGVLPFEQQPRESAKAFAAFRIYLDMGAQRSTREVGKQLGKSEGLMERWAAKFDWRSRVQAHAAHLAEVERKAIESMAVEKAVEWAKLEEAMRREAWKEAEETIEMVRQARKEWLEKGRLPGWEGMARMLELAFKLKQIATGQDGDRRREDTPTVRVEVNVALQKIYGEPLPEEVAGPRPVIDVEEVKP